MSGPTKRRVCVIGCGPSGMSMLFELGKLPDDQIPDIVCYEKQGTVGGLWNISWRTGTDEYGEQSHPSMYHDMWTNSPKESLEYPDYTFEEHFGKLVPSFLPRAAVRDYIEGRFTRGRKRDLKQFVKFSTVVRRVEYHEDTDDFTVITNNLKANVEEIERFTHVVVSVGTFTLPNCPPIPGIEDFPGRVLHSKDVKHIAEFKSQRVLIVGASRSGEDLAILAIKFGAKNVIVSWKYRPLGHNWPNGIEERPLVEKFEGDTAHFKDGTTAEVDVVLFCTGYRMEFPFLSEELRLKTKMLFYPENLYKGILWTKGGNDKLMYVGMHYNIYIFTAAAAMAVWACRNIMGTLKLPSKEEMLADCVEWEQKVKKATENHSFEETMEFMSEYLRHIVETVGYLNDVLRAKGVIAEMFENRAKNFCTWRDQQMKCIFTGKLSPAPRIPYMDNFDDSLMSFLDQHP